jgi:rubrerythrin
MKTSVFQYIVDLEYDLADFYRRLRSLSHMTGSAELFDFMSEHSEGHGKTVASLESKLRRPKLDQAFFSHVHGQIKESLFEEVIAAEDMTEALQKISKAEELAGKMYQLIAKHYRDLSKYYLEVSEEITQIAEEEFIHRDMVLRENRKY